MEVTINLCWIMFLIFILAIIITFVVARGYKYELDNKNNTVLIRASKR